MSLFRIGKLLNVRFPHFLLSALQESHYLLPILIR